MKCLLFYGLFKLNIKAFKALFVRALHYRDLQARVHEQETINLTL